VALLASKELPLLSIHNYFKRGEESRREMRVKGPATRYSCQRSSGMIHKEVGPEKIMQRAESIALIHTQKWNHLNDGFRNSEWEIEKENEGGTLKGFRISD
jgi:hypothetical protein